MRLELLNTGTELLLGNTLNSHLPYLARALFPLGFRIDRQVTVPDGDAIRDALHDALCRSEIVLVTGGLGPTSDDLTREIVASLLGRPLARDESVARSIEARFARRGKPVLERSYRQADVPGGARVLENPHGTAPGLALDADWAEGPRPGRRHLFLLPGPPRELHPMVATHLLPALAALRPRENPVGIREWIIAGLGESEVEALVGPELEAIPGLELGYCARPGEVEIRLIAPPAALERANATIAARLGGRVVSAEGETLPQVVLRMLAGRGETVAFAESCTGGALASSLTDLPGASEVFVEGFVTYANRAKESRLGVSAGLIRDRGAVSAEVASAMAEGALAASGADWAVSVTGIAGPGGGTEEKPVGTVFMAVAGRGGVRETEKHLFPFDRETFKRIACRYAMDMLRRALAGRH